MRLYPISTQRPRRITSFLLRVGSTLAVVAMALALTGTAAGQDVIAGTLTPASPSYVDPVMLNVSVITGPSNGTGVAYSVDGGTSMSDSQVTNGMYIISLGSFAPGVHTVTYQYFGYASGEQSPVMQTQFTVSDLPFQFVASEQTVIYNHSGFAYSAVDSSNNVFITNSSENNLYKLDPQHNLTVFPTNGLSNPLGIVVDASDNMYVADSGNNRIIEITPAGVQTTVGVTGLSGPTSLTFDRSFSNLYITDLGNGVVVKYTIATGVQTTVVSGIARMTGLAVDLSENLYIGQHYSYSCGSLYKLDTSGSLTSGYFGLCSPNTLTTDAQGNLYITDDYQGLNRYDPNGHMVHLQNFYQGGLASDHAGQVYVFGIYSYVFTPGPAAKLANAGASGLTYPNGAPSTSTFIYQVPNSKTLSSVDTTGGDGNITPQIGSLSCESGAQCSDAIIFGPTFPGLHTGYVIAKLSDNSLLQTNVYGVGFDYNEAFDPGMSTSESSPLQSATGMGEAEDGTIFVSDASAEKVYSFGVGGTSTPLALAFTGLTQPTQLAVDGAKTVYVLDNNTSIISLDTSGNQRTVYATAPNGMSAITSMAIDGAGTLYLGGTMTGMGSIIGTYTTSGVFSVFSSTPAAPAALGVDGVGGIYEADTTTLRRYIATGGTAAPVVAMIATGLVTPAALTVEPSGTVFVGEGAAGTIQQIRPDGSQTTYYSGLGTANAVVEDGRGVLTIADGSNGKLLVTDRRSGNYIFADQVINTTSAPLPGTLTNDGNVVSGGLDEVTGTSNFPQVAETGACVAAAGGGGTVLAPGTSCKFDYTFTPTAISAYTGSVLLTGVPGGGYSHINFAGNGIAALKVTATLSPTSYNFGSVVADASSPVASQTFTLTNTGTAALTNAVAITGTTASAFTFTANTCGTLLAAGANCTMTILFNPSAAGGFAATLAVSSVNGTTTINESSALSGTGLTPPTLTAAPNPVNFPSTTVNTTATASLTLTNTGASTLNFQTTIATLGGADPTNFTFGSACGYNLAPSASCILAVTFTPTSVRTFNAILTISSNDPNSPTVVVLTGNGSGVLSISPLTQTFVSTAVGSTSATQFSVITNATAQAVYLSSGSLTDASDFTQTDSCSGLVAAGGSCTVTFAFIPKTTGALSSTYAIHNLNTPTSSLNVALIGTGTASLVPIATLTPSTLSFTAISGTSSATQTVTLVNSGNAPLTIAGIGLTGTNSASFSQTNTCGATLAAAANCTISVSLNTSAAGVFSADVLVTDNSGSTGATTTTQSSTLAGTVTSATSLTDFTIAATPPAQSTYRGTSVTYKLQLASLAGGSPFTSVVTMSVSGLPAGATASFSPATLVPGIQGSTVLTVMVPPLSAQNTPSQLPGFPQRGVAMSLAVILGAGLFRRKQPHVRLILLFLVIAALASAITGCGTGTGFSVGSSTTSLTITGTASAISHATTVTLTIQ